MRKSVGKCCQLQRVTEVESLPRCLYTSHRPRKCPYSRFFEISEKAILSGI